MTNGSRTSTQNRDAGETRAYVYRATEWPGGVSCAQCERDIDEGETIYSVPVEDKPNIPIPASVRSEAIEMGARLDALQFVIVCAVCAGRAA